MHGLNYAPPNAEVLENILSGSSAFDHSDQGDLDKGAAELNNLPEEPSGQYEGESIDMLDVDEDVPELAKLPKHPYGQYEGGPISMLQVDAGVAVDAGAAVDAPEGVDARAEGGDEVEVS